MRRCNKCNASTTSDYDGYEHWYTDPLYTSKILCHHCYSNENIEIYSKLRKQFTRIERPREARAE